MNYSTYRFTLDLHKHQSQMSIAVFKGDTAVRLIISLTDGGKPYFIKKGTSAILFGTRPDRKPIIHGCAILDSGDERGDTEIVYTFRSSTSFIEGITNVQLRLYDVKAIPIPEDLNDEYTVEEKLAEYAKYLITAPKFTITVDGRTVNDENVEIPDDTLAKIDEMFLFEGVRETNEQARKEAESAREAAEVKRQSDFETNESNRQTTFDEKVEALLDDVKDKVAGGFFVDEIDSIQYDETTDCIIFTYADGLVASIPVSKFTNKLEEVKKEVKANYVPLLKVQDAAEEAEGGIPWFTKPQNAYPRVYTESAVSNAPYNKHFLTDRPVAPIDPNGRTAEYGKGVYFTKMDEVKVASELTDRTILKTNSGDSGYVGIDLSGDGRWVYCKKLDKGSGDREIWINPTCKDKTLGDGKKVIIEFDMEMIHFAPLTGETYNKGWTFKIAPLFDGYRAITTSAGNKSSLLLYVEEDKLRVRVNGVSEKSYNLNPRNIFNFKLAMFNKKYYVYINDYLMGTGDSVLNTDTATAFSRMGIFLNDKDSVGFYIANLFCGVVEGEDELSGRYLGSIPVRRQNKHILVPGTLSEYKDDKLEGLSADEYALSYGAANELIVEKTENKADLVDGKIPASQLPSYVDDVLEYPNITFFPANGDGGKIYVATATNKVYRWSGTTYVSMPKSLALGENSASAYRGDRGKIAYDHSQTTSGNPHNVTAAEVGAATADDIANFATNTLVPAINKKFEEALSYADNNDSLRMFTVKEGKTETDDQNNRIGVYVVDVTNSGKPPIKNGYTAVVKPNGTFDSFIYRKRKIRFVYEGEVFHEAPVWYYSLGPNPRDDFYHINDAAPFHIITYDATAKRWYIASTTAGYKTDSVPTEDSTRPITSGGVYAGVSSALSSAKDYADDIRVNTYFIKAPVLTLTNGSVDGWIYGKVTGLLKSTEENCATDEKGVLRGPSFVQNLFTTPEVGQLIVKLHDAYFIETTDSHSGEDSFDILDNPGTRRDIHWIKRVELPDNYGYDYCYNSDDLTNFVRDYDFYIGKPTVLWYS